MRMESHSVKAVTYSRNAYGEAVKTYGEAEAVPMFIAWNSRTENADNGGIYASYEYVALTKSYVEVGSMIDDLYIVGGIEFGRFNRLYLKTVNKDVPLQ